MKQEINKYTEKDNWVWNQLFVRQKENLKPKASEAYFNSLEKMNEVLNDRHIPDFNKVNKWFLNETGWQIEVVKGLIPVEDFFELLSQKKFCSSTWLRNPQQLDYLEEPDMFHDIFGHIPLLSHSVFSEFAYEFGKLGKMHSKNIDSIVALQRLYWFTIEFGLIKEKEIKVYGAGIISSYSETNKAILAKTNHLDFSIELILNNSFETNTMQSSYYVIESYDQLFNSIDITDKMLNTKHEFI